MLHRERRRAEALRKISMQAYEVRPRKDHRGVDLMSDALPVRSAVVWRAERYRQRNRIRTALQPLT